jgi:hypothetical protein
LEHGFDAIEDVLEREVALLCNELKGVAVEALDAVFANGEDLGVKGFSVFNGKGVHGVW